MTLLLGHLLLVAAVAASTATTKLNEIDKPSFVIDYENDQFLMDGKPFTYVAGEMHYFRIPRPYWKDRLMKCKAAGLNAVSTYVDWGLHEPSPGDYKFTGDNDLVHYIKLAQELGLYVILRPGPYICAEREFGGYPPWLLTLNPKVKLRTADPSHTFFVARWFRRLMAQIVPLLYGNGGPIIMVQVENEYGSYPINDVSYLNWLKDLFTSYVKGNAVLFTTDGPASNYITRGMIKGVFTTVDFAPSKTKVMTTFAPLRKFQPKGPLVNSEFYVGWLSYWGQNMAVTEIGPIIQTMSDMLAHNVSFSMYMFHGGTNFGFSAGSGSDNYFLPDLTSYDYDAPISEAGDLTDKYRAIQKLLLKHYNIEEIVVENSQKGDYGKVTLEPVVSLFKSPIGTEPLFSKYPLTFEQIGQSYGFVKYDTRVISYPRDPSVFQATLRDRGIIYIDDVEASVLQYTVINETPLPPSLRLDQKISILIENMGRRNFKLMSDCTKGLVSNATMDRIILKHWNITGYPLNEEDIIKVESLERDPSARMPAFYSGQFQLKKGEEPLDTFLDTTDWGKGVAFINGFNLGRYWHVGPQVTLYVPGVYLRKYPANNTVTLLELHYTNRDSSMKFVPVPYINKTTSPSLYDL